MRNAHAFITFYHLSQPIFWFAHPMFLTSLRQCFRSTLFDPNTAFIRPVLLYLPVQHALSPFFCLSSPPCSFPLSSRHDPGYHLPCHTLSFFLRHPPPPIVYPSCLSLPPRCCSSSVDCRRAKLSPSYSVDRHPSSRHTLLYAASLSSAFPCPIASYKAITLCLHPFLSVCRLFPSVRLRLFFCFSVTKDGYLSTLCIYLLK